MKTHLTIADAAAFKARWAVANRAERKELRSTTAARKFQQLAAFMASANKFGWTEPLAKKEI